MLDGGVNDYVEAKALSLRRNYIDVYSASWGPEDDGKTVDGPGPLARRAFIEGAVKVATRPILNLPFLNQHGTVRLPCPASGVLPSAESAL